MRRIFFDVLSLALLIGLVELLPSTASLMIGLCIPVLVGFGRGYVERRFLNVIPYWIGVIEWALIVFASDIILCIPNSKSDPHDNFLTVFGAFFIILIVPSVVLSTMSYATGLLFAKTRTTRPEL
jgi:hypothetical protein